MIRVVKPAPPAALLTKGTAARQNLCAVFDSAPHDYNSGTKILKIDESIFKSPEVKGALARAQHGKCAFCESLFAHVDFGDVEHFRPKAGYRQRRSDKLKRPGYYWLAYDWANLFYSCKLCNQRFKANHFPIKDWRSRARWHADDIGREEPLLIDPSKFDPAVYIGFRGDVIYAVGGCPEGKTTIRVLGLRRKELKEHRRKRLDDLKTLIQLCALLRERVATNPTPEWRMRLRAYEKKLAAKREPAAEYTAMARAFLDSLPTTGNF